MHLTDEEKLIDRAIGGNQRAFGELVKRYDRSIYNLLLNILKNDSDAQDAYQATFMKAYLNISKFNRQSKIHTWLYRIAINTAYTYYKKRGRDNDPLLSEDVETIESIYNIGAEDQSLEDDEQRSIVREEVEKLSYQQKSVLYLKSFEGKKFSEIAELLSINVGTAKAYFHRAVQNLKTALHCKEE